MKKQPLFNKINREVLKDLLNETFERVTVSFYKYFEIHSPGSWNDLYKKFDQLKIFAEYILLKKVLMLKLVFLDIIGMYLKIN